MTEQRVRQFIERTIPASVRKARAAEIAVVTKQAIDVVERMKAAAATNAIAAALPVVCGQLLDGGEDCASLIGDTSSVSKACTLMIRSAKASGVPTLCDETQNDLLREKPTVADDQATVMDRALSSLLANCGHCAPDRRTQVRADQRTV